MTTPFGYKLNTKHREAILQRMTVGKLDILVIGGGITGAGIAMDAASRGLNTGLVEKQDFGAGTSSRSTKLIHGGLRYLKQGEFNLVREVGRERAILYRNAPHIVHPERMLLPLVKGGTYGKLATSIGLWVYDRLAGVAKDERRRMLTREETIGLEPLLRQDILSGGGLYIEYRTDDARLTIETMKTAASCGAKCVNYAEAVQFIYEKEKVTGVRVIDRITGKEYTIYASKIVNAAGPWVDRLRIEDKSLYGKRLHLTKGVHLVVPHKRLPLKQSVYFDVPDGRMIFAIPRDGRTYIGTTDTNYEGPLERPQVTMEDATYLITSVNYMFPSAKLNIEDVESSWSGLRPLIHEDGKTPSELSRRDEIFQSPSGLITIAGGKLSGFRKMAQRVVDAVTERLAAERHYRFTGCMTDALKLGGGNFSSPGELELFRMELRLKYREVTEGKEQIVNSLVDKYGMDAVAILEDASRLKQDGMAVEISLLLAELRYGLEEEMVVHPGDFLIRRTGLLYFNRPEVGRLHPIVKKYMKDALNWTEEQALQYHRELQSEYEAAVHFGD
jgi:glycerol-3-phosphate dehydrogenase